MRLVTSVPRNQWRTTKPRPARQSGSLFGRAQTSRRRLAMTRQAWAKYQCQSRRVNFQKERWMIKEQKLKPPHTPKPNVVGDVVQVAVVAVGAPRIVGVVVQIAAAQHTEDQRPDRPAWIGSAQIWTARRIRRGCIPIPTPLEYIPRHVVDRKSVV